jgi:hypothetical protein
MNDHWQRLPASLETLEAAAEVTPVAVDKAR